MVSERTPTADWTRLPLRVWVMHPAPDADCSFKLAFEIHSAEGVCGGAVELALTETDRQSVVAKNGTPL